MKNFLKSFKVLDIVIIVAVLLALVVGFLTYKHFRQTGDKQIEKTAKIGFQVFLRGVTITGPMNPIKIADTTFISIRNVPYTDLKIIDVKVNPKKIVMPNPKGKEPFTLVDDYSQLFMYDVIVSVIDTAKITKDGAVVGGNKIKIGLPITLEGKDYKFNGTVSDIATFTDEQAQQIEEAINKVSMQRMQQGMQGQETPLQGAKPQGAPSQNSGPMSQPAPQK